MELEPNNLPQPAVEGGEPNPLFSDLPQAPEPPTDLPRGFRIQGGDLYPSPFSAGDIIMINTDRVIQRRQMRRITRDGRR